MLFVIVFYGIIGYIYSNQLKYMRFLLICITFFLTTQVYADRHDSLLEKGIALYGQGEYEKSIAVLETRLKTAISENDKQLQKDIYNNLGNDYCDLGKTLAAVEAYQHAITIAEEVKDMKSVARVTKNIGAVYSETKDFSKAMQKYDEAEAIGQKINDTSVLADCANNKGVVLEQQTKYPEALLQYSKALELYKQLNKEDRIAITYNNLGIVYKYLKNYDSSIACYDRSRMIADRMGNKFLVAANIVNMGNVYEMKGDYKKAIALNEKGLQIGKEINSQELVMEVYDNLATEYAKAGDYQKGYELYKTYMATKDSFINVERSKQVADMQTKYETLKKEQQIIKLEKTRVQMLAIIGIMVLLIIVAYLLYNRQQIHQRQAREKAVHEAEFNERMRIAKDVHDDLGSGLSKISLTASVAEQKALANGNAAQDVRHIATMSKDLVDNMRDLIWVLNPDNTTLDNLVARMREYCADYLDGFGIDTTIDFPQHVPQMRISREAQRNIFATVKESIHNCVKHAGATEINIKLQLTANNLEITISDNGKGFDPDQIKGSGNGLRNMKQRIESVGGIFSITPAPARGTLVSISVPVKNLAGAHTPVLT